MISAPLLALLLAVPSLGSSPPPAAPPAERVPVAGPILDLDTLKTALLDLEEERNGLREALGAAEAEIARLRAAYDALDGQKEECESDLTRALDLNARLMESHTALSGILTQERKAATRARWIDRLGCTVGVGVSGWGEAAGGASVTCGVRAFP